MPSAPHARVFRSPSPPPSPLPAVSPHTIGPSHAAAPQGVEAVHEELGRRQELLRRAAMRLVNASLVQTLDAWKQLVQLNLVERAQREQRAVAMYARWLFGTVAVCFQAWAEWKDDVRAIKRRAANAIGPGRLLHMCMRTWAAAVREQVRQKQKDWVASLLGDELPRLIDERLAREIADKVDTVQSAHAGRAEEMGRTIEQLQRQLSGLRAQVQTANARRLQERQHAIHRILRQWRHTHSLRAMAGWKEYVAGARQLLLRAMAHWKHMPVRRCLSEWADYAAYMRHLHRTAALVRSRIGVQLGSVVFREWRHAARNAAAARKTAVLLALGKWANKTAAFAFYPWRAYAVKSARVGRMHAQAARRLKYGLLADVFDGLAGLVAEKRQRRDGILREAALRLVARHAFLALHAWREEVRARIERRGALYVTAARRSRQPPHRARLRGVDRVPQREARHPRPRGVLLRRRLHPRRHLWPLAQAVGARAQGQADGVAAARPQAGRRGLAHRDARSNHPDVAARGVAPPRRRRLRRRRRRRWRRLLARAVAQPGARTRRGRWRRERRKRRR